MKRNAHGNRRSRRLHSATACLLLGGMLGSLGRGQDDVADLLGNAKPVTTAPQAVTSPDAAEFRPPPPHATPGNATRVPAEARQAKIVLSDGTRLEGWVWTTLQTPLRLWVQEDSRYHDFDLALVTRIEVKVLKEGLEDDWRWLKEGSDQKVYSGKKYPNVELAYKVTLANGQEIEGGVVAPLYLASGEGGRVRTLALYKKFKGALDQTMKDVVYVKEVVLEGTVTEGEGGAEKGKGDVLTRKLPLLPD